MRTTFLILALLAFAAPALAQIGSIDPPAGPVEETMKPLDVVEARTPVGPDTTPGDASSVFLIDEPGSYYLVGDVQGEANKNGIAITADNVTLDLNGFTLRGVPNSLDGINTFGATGSVTIKNGTVRDFDGTGVLLDIAPAHVTDLTLVNNTTAGLAMNSPSSARIERCHSVGNGDLAQIEFTAGFVILGPAIAKDLTSRSDTTAFIVAGTSVAFERCVVEDPAGVGFLVVPNTTATFNHCTAARGDADGFCFGSGTVASLSACVATENASNGFFANGDGASAIGLVSLTLNACQAHNNGQSGFSARSAEMVMRDSIATRNGVNGINVTRTNLDPSLSVGFTATGCATANNAFNGFSVNATASVLTDCRAVDDGSVAFRVSQDSVLTRCTAARPGFDAIAIGTGSSLIDCTVTDAGRAAITAFSGQDGAALLRMRGCRILDCARGAELDRACDIADCDFERCAEFGLKVGDECIVRACRFVDNPDVGVLMSRDVVQDPVEDVRILESHFIGSPFVGNTVGVDTNQRVRTLIDGNTFTGLTIAIDLDSFGDTTVIRNVFSNNTQDFNPATGNNIASVVSPAAGTASPFANLIY